MVSVSPRVPDLDTDEEPPFTDHRFAAGFRSLSLDSAGYSDIEHPGDARAFSATPDSSSTRRKRRQRESDSEFAFAEPFRYQTVADGDLFRLIVLHPGTGSNPIRCNLLWESSRSPTRNYCCLSYAWESVHRNAALLCDDLRLPVTENLLRALHNLRRPRTALLIWADQICINQDNDIERAHQVSIMKHIFNKAHKIYVWLGEHDDRSEKLCEYAKRMRRGEESPKSILSRLLSQRELKDAIQKFLQRPWFQRVWVIPEVALSRHTTVACGRSHISWDNLVRLIRDVAVPTPHILSFDKQVSLLGNPRQRTAIITQMIFSQKQSRAHTDITQLLILAKSSKATDVRDMVYAFYGLTHLTTYPDYSRPVGELYVEVIEMYISSILWETSYSTWHDLSDAHKTFQLMSILYSAGALHQHIRLPSWVPDLTHAWQLAPVWCKTTPNFVTGASRDEWSAGIRTAFRAGGHTLGSYEVVAASRRSASSPPALRVSALVIVALALVNELTPTSSQSDTALDAASLAYADERADAEKDNDTPALRYGRHFFTTATITTTATTAANSATDTSSTARGVPVAGSPTSFLPQSFSGFASPGVAAGDMLAVLLGADVPVVLRPAPAHGLRRDRAFYLLCEAYVQSPALMRGDVLAERRALVEDVLLI